MKRNEEQHDIPRDTETNPATQTVEPGVSAHATTTRASESHTAHPEAVTILIEGGGFSFNDVFPMGSRGLAAENGRAIATFALSLVAPRRRRSSGRSVEE